MLRPMAYFIAPTWPPCERLRIADLDHAGAAPRFPPRLPMILRCPGFMAMTSYCMAASPERKA